MDTVSMLNKMSFYCQPILPLVYDESLSYYEKLCKVVGQLNTTGDVVNKLNEGLTGEIADRQAADAELDERLKVIEDTNKKIHFLVFDGANPNGVFPTRHELYQWVEAGDAIFTLLGTYEEGRGQIYAASCSYNAGNWGSEASNDFSIIVPLETTYDSTGKLAVKQKIVKLTIPPIPQTNLNAPWGLQIIEINTPSTSAEGIVNFSATVDNENTVRANLSPAEFTYLYRAASKGSGLIVGVNAQLTTNDSQLLLSTTADIIGGETASDDEVRIVFDAETSTGERGLDLPYLNRLIYILSGSGTSETWTLTEFETYDFAFDRYEGFQFTRAANNVITPAFGSTPKDVAEYFGTVKGGTPYQNLPVRLIDTVDNAEYWNGVFDIKDGNHMTFTFVTSNYATASDKMAVRVIELSADANTTVWKYAEKEFTLPLSGGSAPTYVDFWGTGQSEVYGNGLKAWTVSLGTDKTFDYIFDLISSGANVVARLYMDSTKAELVSKSMEANISGDKTLGFINFLFMHAADDVAFGFPTIADAVWVTKTSAGTSAYALYKWCALPVPVGDGTDNGKVPTVNGTKWELKTLPTAATVDTAMSDTSTNAVQNKVIKKYVDNNAARAGAVRYDAAQTLTFEQKQRARKNIEAADSVWPTITGGVSLCPEHITDSNFAAHVTTTIASGEDYTVTFDGGPENVLVRVDGIRTPTDTDTNAAATVEYVLSKAASDFVVNATLNSDSKVTLDKTFAQIQAAIQEGKHPVVKASEGGYVTVMPMVSAEPSLVLFAAVSDITDRNITDISLTITADDAIAAALASPALNDDGALLQYSMESDPRGAMDIATKKYVDDHAGSRVALSGTVEGEVSGYTTATYLQIVDEIAKTGNIWLTISGETVRLASYKQSGGSAYILVFFGAGGGALTAKYEVTATVSSASLTVTGS